MSRGRPPRIPALPLGDSARVRRRPERSALYRVLARHVNTFVEQAESSDGGGLPWFVKRELKGFLRCGILAHGFARVWCPGCRSDSVVAFSCKFRGFCPSCGARRMADGAAHLVDRVLPDVPLRQWVLTFPFRLRFLLAYNARLCRSVRRVTMRAILAFQRRRARAVGIGGGESGAVCSLQRAGGAVNVNVHFHVLVLDGVFHENGSGATVEFAWLKSPSESEIGGLLATIRQRIERLLARLGLDVEGGLEDAGSGLANCLVGAGRVRPRHVGREPLAARVRMTKRRCAEFEGYTLHADTMVPAGDLERRERLARYVLRPALSNERLSLTAEGRVLYKLRTVFADGTTALLFEPLEFIAKLAALVPPPRFHLVTYHGVLAPNHTWRSRVVPGRRSTAVRSSQAEPGDRPRRRLSWAELLRRTFAYDVLHCDRCGSRKRLIATITDRAVIERFLAAFGESSEPPFIHPARSDPLLF